MEILGYDYIEEFCFKNNKWRYDFCIDGYILEFDGVQHFKHTTFFTPNPEALEVSRQRDIDKTLLCLKEGYKVIRLSYNCPIRPIEQFVEIVEEAMFHLKETNEKIWVSDINLYSWLLDGLQNSNTGRKSVIKRKINIIRK